MIILSAPLQIKRNSFDLNKSSSNNGYTITDILLRSAVNKKVFISLNFILLELLMSLIQITLSISIDLYSYPQNFEKLTNANSSGEDAKY